jgi:hypothetical protein
VREIAVGHPADDLVHDVEAHPDGDLEEEMSPPTRKTPGDLCGGTRHDAGF